jgi:murein DD-endopeptidase MepM/ murein hydrolase activator NlpD
MSLIRRLQEWRRRWQPVRPERTDRTVLVASGLAVATALALPPSSQGSGEAPPETAALKTPILIADARMSPSACGAGSIPDGEGAAAACVRPPEDDEGTEPPAESVSNSHRDREGRWVVYDQIPRRPDRPADYDAYRYPVPCDRSCVTSGYDLDRPDELQRRGHRLRQVGHGALDLAASRGTPVSVVELAHQQGPSEVLYVGTLFGNSVITRHTLREGSALRDYIVLLGHLDAYAANLRVGSPLHPGNVIGAVGDSGSPGLVHLHLEVRRVRGDLAKGGELERLAHEDPSALVGTATIVCDPRNVLPLR